VHERPTGPPEDWEFGSVFLLYDNSKKGYENETTRHINGRVVVTAEIRRRNYRNISKPRQKSKGESMGYLKDDILHLQADLEHIQQDIGRFKNKLDKDELTITPLGDLLQLGDFLAHIGDLEDHVNDVMAHIAHVDMQVRGKSPCSVTLAETITGPDCGDS
jgi:hypothetical protein